MDPPQQDLVRRTVRRHPDGGSEEDQAGTAGTPDPQDGPVAGLAATAGEDEGLTAAQAAALIRAAGGNGATVPLFAPDQPPADERTPSKDW